MTREEFEQIVSETRLDTINTFYDDNMRNLLEEVYHAGFQDGYSNAIFKLQLFEGRSIFAAADKEFFEKNNDKIKRRIEAIKEFEAEGYSELKIPESQEEFDACNDEVTDEDLKRLYKYQLAKSFLSRDDDLTVEDGVVKKRIAPKLILTQAGNKGLYPGISVVQAKAIGLSIEDLWRMAENEESILVDVELLTIDNTTIEERLADLVSETGI